MMAVHTPYGNGISYVLSLKRGKASVWMQNEQRCLP